MIQKSAALIVIACGLCGCVLPSAQTQWTEPKAAYVETAYTWAAGTGPAAITGQAFLRTRGGDVKTCAGSDVKLVPDGVYTQEVLSLMLTGKSVTVADGFVAKKRVTQCDAQGNFRFDGLPQGKWLIQTNVTWEVPTQYYMDEQGGSLVQAVTTPGQGLVHAILSDRDFNVDHKVAF